MCTVPSSGKANQISPGKGTVQYINLQNLTFVEESYYKLPIDV